MRTAVDLLKHRPDGIRDIAETSDERLKQQRWQTKQRAIESVLAILCVSGALYFGFNCVFVICAVAAMVMICARVPEWIPSEHKLRITQHRRLNRFKSKDDFNSTLVYLQYRPKNVFERLTPSGHSLFGCAQVPFMIVVIGVGLVCGPIVMAILLLLSWGLWGWLFRWADSLDGLCNATLYLDDEGFWFNFQQINKALEETEKIRWEQVQSIVFSKIKGKFFDDPILQVRIYKHLLSPNLQSQILAKKMLWPVMDGSAHSLLFNIRADAFLSRLHRKDLLDHLCRHLPAEKFLRDQESMQSDPPGISYTQLWMDSLLTNRRENLNELECGNSLSKGKYLIIDELGTGGQATTYTASDVNGATVVVKEFVLPSSCAGSTKRRCIENIEKEAKLLSCLDHPQIVKFLDFFVEDQRAYLVTDHIDGFNLRRYLQDNKPFSEDASISLAAQMCDILDYLHGRQPPVIHRDFTPDNLIFANCATLKLIDFNVAQQLASAGSRTVVGKHAYIPPEQFRGKATIASDIYALGATMFFLLTGSDPEPITQSHPQQLRSQVSSELDAIVAKATSPKESERYTDAREVRTDLVRLKAMSTA